MNLAISDTNVVLDTAISPSLWLLPSNVIIQKNIIPGYNNMLKVASKNMKFGLNKNINHYASERSEHQPKKIHQNLVKTSHLDSLNSYKVLSTKPTISIKSLRGDRAATEGSNPLSSQSQQIVFVFAAVGGISIKYLL